MAQKRYSGRVATLYGVLRSGRQATKLLVICGRRDAMQQPKGPFQMMVTCALMVR